MEPEQIFRDLEKIYKVPLAHKSKVLALTVPEAGVKGNRERIDAKRNKLNEMIMGYKRDNL
jgi:hypothetical protein